MGKKYGKCFRDIARAILPQNFIFIWKPDGLTIRYKEIFTRQDLNIQILFQITTGTVVTYEANKQNLLSFFF